MEPVPGWGGSRCLALQGGACFWGCSHCAGLLDRGRERRLFLVELLVRGTTGWRTEEGLFVGGGSCFLGLQGGACFLGSSQSPPHPPSDGLPPEGGRLGLAAARTCLGLVPTVAISSIPGTNTSTPLKHPPGRIKYLALTLSKHHVSPMASSPKCICPAVRFQHDQRP